MVRVPLRAAPVLRATEKLNLPKPVRLASEVITIQSALLTAVQLQPGAALTLAVPLPPALVNESERETR